MTPPGDLERKRLPAALRLVVRRYAAQVRRQPWVAIPALVLPGFARILDAYAPPLVVARLLGAFARQERLTAGELAPYVLAFAGVWLLGEVLWRIALVLVTRAEIRGLEALYVEAMDELLAKDLAFFQDNFAGSLTKRALGYARVRKNPCAPAEDDRTRAARQQEVLHGIDRKSTRLNSSHCTPSRMPSSA